MTAWWPLASSARIYAAANVPEYWVVNTKDALIEVYRDIVSGVYTRVTPYGAGSTITLEAFADVTITAGQVLGK